MPDPVIKDIIDVCEQEAESIRCAAFTFRMAGLDLLARRLEAMVDRWDAAQPKGAA